MVNMTGAKVAALFQNSKATIDRGTTCEMQHNRGIFSRISHKGSSMPMLTRKLAL